MSLNALPPSIRRPFYLLLFIFFAHSPTDLTAQLYEWATIIENYYVADVAGIAVHPGGNYYMYGIGSGPGSSTDPRVQQIGHAEIGCFNPNVAISDSLGLEWGWSFGGVHASENTRDVDFDPAGFVYACGETGYGGWPGDTFRFGNITETVKGNNDAFISKLDGNGNFLWGQTFGGPESDQASSITCDPSANLYVAGYFSDSMFLNGDTFFTHHPINADMFIASFDSSGNFRWLVEDEHNGNSQLYEIISDSAHNLYVSGRFEDTLQIAGQVITSGFNFHNFVAKFDSSGNLLWISPQGISGSFRNLRVDNLGNLYSVMTSYWGGNLGGTIYSPDEFDIIFCKFSPTGSILWSQTINGPKHQISAGLEVNDEGELFISGAFDSIFVYQNFDTLANPIYRNGFLAKFDTSGIFHWISIAQGQSSTAGAFLKINLINNENLLIHGRTSSSSFSYGALTLPVSSNRPSLIGLDLNTIPCKIEGQLFVDANLNQQFDSNEATVPGLLVDVDPGFIFALSGSDGTYFHETDTGTFQTSILQLPNYYIPSPSYYSTTHTFPGNRDTMAHLGIAPIPGIQDLQVFASPMSAARPGFPFSQKVTYRNMGTTLVTQGQIELTMDSTFVFGNAMPAVDSVVGQTMYWNFDSLNPFESRDVMVTGSVLASTPLGSVFNGTATVFPVLGDTVPGDNTHSYSLEVIGSWDPNDKLVFPSTLSPDQASNGHYFNYLIRFQNTGTDTAFHVVIRDTLSPLLDLPTFQMITASHPYTMQVDTARELVWEFEHISLPDSGVNFAESQGFVSFRVRPVSGLPVGTVIPNDAEIFFDFNAPVETEVVESSIDTLVVTAEQVATGFEVQAFPVPADDVLRLVWKGGELARTVQVVDLGTGKVLVEVTGETLETGKIDLDVSELAAGAYGLRVEMEGGNWGRVILVR